MCFHRFRERDGERQFAILYDVRGRGTSLARNATARRSSRCLRAARARVRRCLRRPQNLLLVAGGLGVAAVIALADEAVAGAEERHAAAGRAERGAPLPARHAADRVEAVSATDDGSAGHHGLVTDLLAEHLLVGGPDLRLRAEPDVRVDGRVVKDARSRKPVQALLEERMGCGTGVCYGCAVFTRKGVRLVCKDGPRFELREVFS